MNEPAPRVGWQMWKRFLLAFGIIVVLSAGATATAGLLEVRNVADALEESPRADVGQELTRAQVGGPQTIMLLGSDRRSTEGVPGNSDTIMLVRLDPDRGATTLLSVPRDLKVRFFHRGRRVTEKINAAYRMGGTRLALRVVRQTLNLPINHVIDVSTGGFRRMINYIGCVYVDVDRRYFNDNSGPEQYAQIDIQPGYQRLCNYDALAYVRYRHEDNDLVRAARQQEFLRLAKDQTGPGYVLGHRNALLRIFGRSARTDIRGTTELLGLLKLVAYAAGKPVREVRFRGEIGPAYVNSTPAQIRETVNEFLLGRTSEGPRATVRPTRAEAIAARRRRVRPAVGGGLENANEQGQEQAIAIAREVPFPVLYPKVRIRGSVYAGNAPRAYFIRDTQNRRRRAYRMVLKKGLVGEYYGVQGTTWKGAPILRRPSGKRKIGGRTFHLYSDGSHYRLIALRTPKAVYWVSNTLTLTLTNQQMLALAASLTPLGR